MNIFFRLTDPNRFGNGECICNVRVMVTDGGEWCYYCDSDVMIVIDYLCNDETDNEEWH